MTVDEFKKAIQNNCTGKAYADFPKAFKAFIEGLFRTVDIDGIRRETEWLAWASTRFDCFKSLLPATNKRTCFIENNSQSILDIV